MNAPIPAASQPATTRASGWSLEAERLSLDDPLIECLALIAASHGRRTTAVALSAGLPVHGQQMVSPDTFIRAAERAHMTARMVKKTLKDLCAGGNLPCILVLKNRNACILQDAANDTLDIVFPETPGEVMQRSLSDLEAQYEGYAFFVRPQAQLDGRAGPELLEESGNWFWGTIWRYKKIYYEVAAAAVAVNLLGLASPLFTMNVYDRVIPNDAFSTLWALVLGITIAYLFDFLLKNLRAFFIDVAGKKADNIISSRIFERMMGMRLSSQPPSVGVHASNLREFETLREFFTSATIATIIDLPFIVFFIVMIWLIAGPVAVVPAVILPLVICTGIFLQKPLDRTVNTSVRENAFKNSLVFEALSGLETIKVQAAEGHMQRKWEELTQASADTSMRTRLLSSFGINFSIFAANMTTVGIIAYGTYLISDHKITMGALIAAVILAGRAMTPIASIAGLLTRYSQAKKALDQLNEMMRAPVERPVTQTFISKPVVKGKIEFRDVVFQYPRQTTPALQGINFKVEPGQHVGIIGAVGSGKTTIERLILNLYQPQSGSVQVDGVDVRQIDPADLRRNIGVVQQNPYLFYGSVRENITLGHESVPDATVLRVAEMAGVMRFLGDTAAGLDTQVGERGDYLSGGQRQAIAIARALLYDPPILLMDEPTASIDPGSERRLYAHLQELIKGKTLVLVTHKNSVLGLVDTLILMDRGKIAGMGPREEVTAKLQAGAYRTGGGDTSGDGHGR